MLFAAILTIALILILKVTIFAQAEAEGKSNMAGEGGLTALLKQFLFGEDKPGVSPTPKPSDINETAPDNPIPPTIDPLINHAKIPPSARDKIATITVAVEALLSKLQARGPGDPLYDETRRLYEHHLPELLQKYIDIPEAHRAEIFRRTQKSASYHLGASLDLMIDRLGEIDRLLAQGILDEFTNNTRFVDTQYGRSSDLFSNLD